VLFRSAPDGGAIGPGALGLLADERLHPVAAPKIMMQNKYAGRILAAGLGKNRIWRC